MNSDQIKSLASRHGIAMTFEDARGNIVETDSDVARKLLISMGVLDEFGSAIDPDHDASLPPAIVVRADAGGIVIDLGGAILAREIKWQLALEDGTRRNGTSVVTPAGAGVPARLTLPQLPHGYHRLLLTDLSASTTLIVTPGACWLPDSFARNERRYGLSLQLYLLRSAKNWGIGDFTDLQHMVRLAAARGCDVLGLNPLHQMFPDNPEHASPYSPASRRFLNILYIDVTAIPEYERSETAKTLVQSGEFQRRLEQCRNTAQVDYVTVADLKLQALRLVHADFQTSAEPRRTEAFAHFVTIGGDSLHNASLFQALRDHFAATEPTRVDWHRWPDAYRAPDSAGSLTFAREHAERIDFHNWLQWIAEQQLTAAKEAAKAAGMQVGLYLDLAVGCDRSGSETWARPGDYMSAVEVGAPPDIFNPAGQNWGLPPLNPVSLIAEGYQPFIDLLRANMRHGGGLRIDHAMGLQRLYCIPEGSPPSAGAYVNYPMSDLIGILALESQRHHCLVVGEDLGTVPAGFRKRMEDANILSYRVLFFEAENNGEFKPETSYPRLAVAVAGSHDLPTLPSWLSGSDIDLKSRLGLYPSAEEVEAQHKARNREQQAALRLLGLKGPLQQVSPDAFSAAVHGFLGRTRSVLAMTQLDDLLGEQDPVNVPATSTEHPNWRRKYALALEQLEQSPGWKLLDELASGRTDRRSRAPRSEDARGAAPALQ